MMNDLISLGLSLNSGNCCFREGCQVIRLCMTVFQAKEISSLIYQYVALYSSAKQEGQGLAVVLRNNQEVSRT